MGEMGQDDHRMSLTSSDVAAERLAVLRDLFPEAFAEGILDVARLQQAIGQEKEGGRELYGLSWAGKADAIRALQVQSTGTLRPVPEESIDFDTSQNLFIEGDNLEVLKLLQRGYYGKVKMIYIDPPYNTGNEFIYPDNYREGLQEYLRYSGQVDEEGYQQSSNRESNGRYHSRWLSMMYPRLFLARNLLRKDGLLLVSIDDHEVHTLRLLMDEIFGEENFVEQIVWKNKYGSGALTKGFANVHEYILCYTRSELQNITAPLTEAEIKKYKKKDSKFHLRGGYITQPLATTSKDERRNLRYPILHKGAEIWPEKQWVWSQERFELAYRNDEIVITEKNGKFSVRAKQYLRNEDGTIRDGKPVSILNGPFNQEGTQEIKQLFEDAVFGFPKPSALIKHFVSFKINNDQDKEGIYLDFFAGSATLAHAVLALNREEGGNRRFILVQLPEKTENADFPTIADIGKERIRRVIQKLKDEKSAQLDLHPRDEPEDLGFKVFKLSSSNFKIWDAEQAPRDAEGLAEQLRFFADHILPDRSQQDILYELLLKAGLSLTAALETRRLEDKTAYWVEEGALLICLDDELDQASLRAMMALKPQQMLCLDRAFTGKDELLTNTLLEMREHRIEFRTV